MDKEQKRAARKAKLKEGRKQRLKRLLGREPKQHEIENAETDVGLIIKDLEERIERLEDIAEGTVQNPEDMI